MEEKTKPKEEITVRGSKGGGSWMWLEKSPLKKWQAKDKKGTALGGPRERALWGQRASGGDGLKPGKVAGRGRGHQLKSEGRADRMAQPTGKPAGSLRAVENH